MYICRFCGYQSDTLDDFEEDLKYRQGFWCPVCDGYTYFKTPQDEQTFKLILENKIKNGEKANRVPFPTQVSPLRWPGGKSKFVGQLLSYCNPSKMENFVEPYAGGASVGLSLLLAGKIKDFYLNDIDFGVYSLFQLIKDMPEVLIDKIQQFNPTKEAFYQARQKVKENYTDLDMVDAAWNLLVVNRLAYSGIPKANCMSVPEARWSADTLIKRIRNIHRVSENIHVSCMDACELIEEKYWLPNTTIFIDPPYKIKGKDIYVNYYTDKNHYELSNLLDDLYKGMPGADMLITYDDCEFIKEIYEFPDVMTVGRTYSIANRN